MAEVYRPDVLSFRPVLKSELLHSPQVHHGFVQKLSPHSGKNIKKTLLTAGCLPVVPSFWKEGFFLRYATKAAKPSEGW